MENIETIIEENTDVLNRLKSADDSTYTLDKLNSDFTIKKQQKKTKTMSQAHITQWVSLEEATQVINKHVADGTYTKKQIRKSSYRYVDPKDRSKGYQCRVLVEAGVHPELELPDLPKGRKKAEVVGLPKPKRVMPPAVDPAGADPAIPQAI